MKRIGIIGLGNQGLEHLQGSQQCNDVTIVAGFDPSERAVKQCLKHYPELHIASSIDELLNKKSGLEGIIVALPHHEYERVLPSLFETGLPILKEKPLARTVDEARYFISQAKKHGCLLQTAIQRRTHPSYKALKQHIKTQQILEIQLTMNLGFKRSDTDTWRADKTKSGGGALLDSGYHMVDLALFLMGDFDLISSTIFRDEKPCHSSKIDDAFHLSGRQGETWLNISCRTFNDPDQESPQGYEKFEQTKVITNNGIYTANRIGLWFQDNATGNDIMIYACDKNWEIAMADQLTEFANQIDNKITINPNTLWEQHPAQHIIQTAYQMAFNWHSGE